MKYIFLLCFLFISVSAHCQTNELLLWTEGDKLTWDDFKGVPKNTDYDAGSALMISYTVCKRSVWNGKVILKVDCTFDRDVSWVSGEKTDLLLSHEQLHFDVAELFARRLRKEFAVNKLNIDNVDNNAKSYSDRIRLEYENFSSLYDIDTQHGTVKEKQLEWEIKVKKELKALESYKNNKC
ncbi:hypothetical protein [Pontibacter anaerobius]|uniref:DUF922 domain-containing protein n=1 Tax=Pontibacter anaerobius TaxID=2993940 RepID=A0ABT3RGM9_9BACT|nr:hypothetical protein [Pontibacter anaerobius]MCX2740410.1 hypothetical protein [Pontibacter anaerobius]